MDKREAMYRIVMLHRRFTYLCMNGDSENAVKTYSKFVDAVVDLDSQNFEMDIPATNLVRELGKSCIDIAEVFLPNSTDRLSLYQDMAGISVKLRTIHD